MKKRKIPREIEIRRAIFLLAGCILLINCLVFLIASENSLPGKLLLPNIPIIIIQYVDTRKNNWTWWYVIGWIVMVFLPALLFRF